MSVKDRDNIYEEAMEPDRYQQNHLLYIFAMISLLISLGLSFFSLYILPHLLFRWRYGVPEFISYWREWLVENYQLNESQASWVIAAIFLTLALFFGLCAYIASTRIENSIYLEQTQATALSREKRSKGLKESTHFFWKVLGFVILAYAATLAFQWLMSVPPFKELL